MYCTKCGKEIADGARFCEHCGVPVGGRTPASRAPADGRIPASKAPADGRIPASGVSAGGRAPAASGRIPASGEVAADAEVRKTKKKYWLFVLIGLLAVLVSGAAVYLLFFRKGDVNRAASS